MNIIYTTIQFYVNLKILNSTEASSFYDYVFK